MGGPAPAAFFGRWLTCLRDVGYIAYTSWVTSPEDNAWRKLTSRR